MPEGSEIIGAVTGAISAIFTSGIGYGIMKAKVDRLEKVIDDIDKTKVDGQLFEATIKPLNRDLQEIKTDLKRLITMHLTRGNKDESSP